MKVLLISNDVVGSQMAGPGIRYWEMARTLGSAHEVLLAAPPGDAEAPDEFGLRLASVHDYAELMDWADVCISQLFYPRLTLAARRRDVRLIADLYDPLILEELASFQSLPRGQRLARWNRTSAKVHMTVSAADAVLCASDRQRDLWLGFAMAERRLTPQAYDADASLRDLVEVVPFGLPREPPARTGPGFRDRFGIPKDAVVLLWGGGVWNWFDPITLIKAVALVREQRSNVHLVFMGVRRPNARIPQTEMTHRAIALARELDPAGAFVHFNEDWVPYADRHNHLLDADIGVSTHFEHAETRFSFRTRMLDYIWAGLPIVCTAGDSFADLVEAGDLGETVRPEDHIALAQAIDRMAADGPRRKEMRGRLTVLAEQFHWDRVCAPLIRLIERVHSAPRRRPRLSPLLARYYVTTVEDIIAFGRAGEVSRILGERAFRAASRKLSSGRQPSSE